MTVYLDNSATTQPFEQVIQAVAHSMQEGYYNPSALYRPAVEVERSLKAAREVIAATVGAQQQQVLFTSGGTEADNLAVLGHLMLARQAGDVLYTAAEHPAVKAACRQAARYGHQPREIPLTESGRLDLSALEAMLGERTRLICVMQVCNETGVIMPLKAVVALRDRLAPQAAIHVDGVQGYLRIPFSMRQLGVQSYAISAHKIHGPKGVGALVLGQGHRLQPIQVGGGQQGDLRSGTENTAGIAGFAAAVTAYPSQAYTSEHLASLKQAAYAALSEGIPSMRVLGAMPGEEDSAPHILYASFPPVRAETMVHALAEHGVMVGTGSACSSRKSKRSEVLTAMRVPPAIIDSSIRLSFSVTNTAEEISAAMTEFVQQYQLLARFTRR
ncbi:MAG: cysteine desulfurase family protein [Candidatus Limiplasma sp.]|nr:cysteine desulfurase family protein [Candidatus Limiplasma sp.]